MSVVTPEIRFFADCHWLMADNIILLRITPMLPYEWSNLRRLQIHIRNTKRTVRLLAHSP